MSIAKNIRKYNKEIPKNIKLVAVSKTHDSYAILEAYEAGQRIFGENKVQELVHKYEDLPKDIEWHFIGHLQTNKIKKIAPFVSVLHAVDSIKVLKEINKEAQKNNRIIDCLLQLYIAKEDSKFGMSEAELDELLASQKFQTLKNVRIIGLMGMATFIDDENQVRAEFEQLTKTFKEVKEKYFSNLEYFKEISMGMSGDYKIAIDTGSTMIRIGSDIFGKRDYGKE